jgi:hypothetical protein
MKLSWRPLALTIGAALLSHCVGVVPPTAPHADNSLKQNDASPFARLYVLNALGTVTTYRDGRSKLGRTLQGLYKPGGVVVDNGGMVYVTTCSRRCSDPGGVAMIYESGQRFGYITKGIYIPSALARDARQNLYVGNWVVRNKHVYSSYVTEYAPRSFIPLRTISAGIMAPTALAIDQSQNLYVLNYDDITEYAYGRTTSDRTLNVSARCMTTDSIGNVYAGCGSGRTNSMISVFAPHGKDPFEKISQGLEGPVALACDSNGSLYVANARNNTITIYPSGSTSPSATISHGVDKPESLTFDQKGNLYVANGSNSITVYGHSTHALIRKITAGISGPLALTFGA